MTIKIFYKYLKRLEKILKDQVLIKFDENY